mgnify:FL=1
MFAKKIVFFDGDGTLWYPIKTKRREKPHWVYKTEGTADDHCKQLTLIPTVLSTLKKLKKLGVVTVVLSTHPHPPKEAKMLIHHKIEYFKLSELFDEVHATREFHASKGEFIVRILRKRGIAKKDALMVGDNYYWDYKPARSVGIDALLLKSDYMKIDPVARRVKKTINQLGDILR